MLTPSVPSEFFWRSKYFSGNVCRSFFSILDISPEINLEKTFQNSSWKSSIDAFKGSLHEFLQKSLRNISKNSSITSSRKISWNSFQDIHLWFLAFFLRISEKNLKKNLKKNLQELSQRYLWAESLKEFRKKIFETISGEIHARVFELLFKRVKFLKWFLKNKPANKFKWNLWQNTRIDL